MLHNLNLLVLVNMGTDLKIKANFRFGNDMGSKPKMVTVVTYSHCDLSSNLFHWQIAQIHIDQLSDPGN